MMEARALALRLPAPEDANAIQISVQRVQTALIDDTISAKKAGLLLYSLQLAATNIGRTTFGQAEDLELVTHVVDVEEALSQKRSAISQNQNLSTAKDAEDAKEEKGLPLIHTDDTDKKGLPRINTDETDRRSVLRIDADEGGLEMEEDSEDSKVVTMRM
jgi:hypothetical protein